MFQSALAVLGGLMVGLAGYRMFHTAILLYGFVIGAVLGLLVAAPAGPLVAVGALLIGGALGAVAVTLIERLAVVLAGAALGWVVGLGAGAFVGLGPAAPVLGLFTAVIGVGIALIAERLTVTLGTAGVGAWLVVTGAGAMWLGQSLNVRALPALAPEGVAPVLTVVLTGVFALAQLGRQPQRSERHEVRRG